MKRGRLSNDEARYITENAEDISIEEIAANLERDPTTIENFIKKNLKIGLSEFEQAAYDLEDRPYWIELRQQFSQELSDRVTDPITSRKVWELSMQLVGLK